METKQLSALADDLRAANPRPYHRHVLLVPPNPQGQSAELVALARQLGFVGLEDFPEDCPHKGLLLARLKQHWDVRSYCEDNCPRAKLGICPHYEQQRHPPDALILPYRGIGNWLLKGRKYFWVLEDDVPEEDSWAHAWEWAKQGREWRSVITPEILSLIMADKEHEVMAQWLLWQLGSPAYDLQPEKSSEVLPNVAFLRKHGLVFEKHQKSGWWVGLAPRRSVVGGHKGLEKKITVYADLQGKSTREVAQILGVSHSTICRRRARQSREDSKADGESS